MKTALVSARFARLPALAADVYDDLHNMGARMARAGLVRSVDSMYDASERAAILAGYDSAKRCG